jgi:ATP-dependent Lon protease
MPARNEPDTEDIPEDVRRELEFAYATTVAEALDATLEKLVAAPPPPPIPSSDDGRERGATQTQPDPEPVRARER